MGGFCCMNWVKSAPLQSMVTEKLEHTFIQAPTKIKKSNFANCGTAPFDLLTYCLNSREWLCFRFSCLFGCVQRVRLEFSKYNIVTLHFLGQYACSSGRAHFI